MVAMILLLVYFSVTCHMTTNAKIACKISFKTNINAARIFELFIILERMPLIFIGDFGDVKLVVLLNYILSKNAVLFKLHTK